MPKIPKLIFEDVYEIGDIVYLKTDADQKKRIVVGYFVKNKNFMYVLKQGDNESYNFSFEITETKNLD